MEIAGPILQTEAKGRHCSPWPASFLMKAPAQGRGAGLLEHRWGSGGQGMGRGFLSRHSLGVRVAISQGWGVHQILLALTCILIRIEVHLNLSPLFDSGKKP